MWVGGGGGGGGRGEEVWGGGGAVEGILLFSLINPRNLLSHTKGI